jgi:hypothetical protein
MSALKSKNAIVIILVVVLGGLSALPVDAQIFSCLPSCSAQDARFLAIANGVGFITLSEPTLDLEVSVPAGTAIFTVGVFDGDDRGTSGGVGHWDSGAAATFSYTLYADPDRAHSMSTVVPLSGSPSVLSTSMPDNAWIDFSIQTGASAQAPSGNYFYLLRIQLQSLTIATVNAFKIRTGGANVGGTSLFPSPKPFSYIANVFSTADLAIVYPNFPASMTPTNYDGFFSFYFDEPVSQHDVTVWDGDFDHGKFDGTDADTDDPDTPNAPFLPSWATPDALPEGVARGTGPSTGSPPDDRNPTGVTGPFLLKPPSIRYDVIFPDGRTFANNNPSGNQEWEQFKISTDPFDRSQMDYNAAAPLPAGIYQVRIQGLDMANLNALLLPGRVLGIDASGVPCAPLRPFLIGDIVFLDLNGNGVQDLGEPGIPNVIIDLLDENGAPVETAVTDDDGHYSFEVEALLYIVRLGPENFSGGGALQDNDPTTPQECSATIVVSNILACDFGFRRSGTLGGRAWNDLNGNGAQDPGEPGINDVQVFLLDSGDTVIASVFTRDDGNYTFDGSPNPGLHAGTYRVTIDGTTLPGGASPTYDLDGVATPGTAVVVEVAGGSRTDVVFGYQGDASVGDRVWKDANGNGVQDAGEAGLNGITLQLFDFNGNLVGTTVTSGDGNYIFSHVLASDAYTVQVDTSTLPAGYVETYDVDGVSTPNAASFHVNAGDHVTKVDFGYRRGLSGRI